MTAATTAAITMNGNPSAFLFCPGGDSFDNFSKELAIAGSPIRILLVLFLFEN
jgi:hypothetical protein